MRVRLLDDSTPVDLSAAEQIRVLGVCNGETVLDKAATGGADGYVTVDLDADDVSVKRRVLLKFTVTWPGSRPQVWPSGDYIVWYVSE